jgi:NOL1/NOP2/sun family putative RNA methylase
MNDTALTSKEYEIARDLAQKYKYLPYMVERYISFLGIEETRKYLTANEKKLYPSIRVNELKISSEDLKNILTRKGFNLRKVQDISYGFKVLKEPMNLGSLHEFLQGYYYLQDIASMIPPIILSPNSSDFVIDMAASPGSKATQLAQIMKNKGKLLLIEKNSQRLSSLRFNLRRMGVKNSILINFNSERLSDLNLKANKILLDAPCSGEGLIRKDPTRKRSKKFEDFNRMQKIQKSLLKEGLTSLAIKGELVYSTCSIAPEENELVLDEVLQEFNKCRIQKISLKMGSPGLTKVYGKNLNEELKNARRLYPHKDDTIGFFICLIQKL